MIIDIEDPEKIKAYFFLKPLPFIKRIKISFSYLFGFISREHFHAIEINKEQAIAYRSLINRWLKDEEEEVVDE